MIAPIISNVLPKDRQKHRYRSNPVKLAMEVAVVAVTAFRSQTMVLAFSTLDLPTTQTCRKASFSYTSVSSRPPTIARFRRQRLEMVASPIELEATATMGNCVTTEVDQITMEDVVASASAEIQKQQLQQQNQDQHKTPFEWFEHHDKARIAESERIGFDRLRLDEDDTQSNEWGGTIDPSEVVSWTVLKALMQDGACSDDTRADYIHHKSVDRRIRDLHKLFEDSGGYLVVKLDESDASTIDDMWATMETYFSLPPDKLQFAKQVLEKEDGTHDPEAGYHFQQTYMNIDGEILPETIQNALSDSSNTSGNHGRETNDQNQHASNESGHDTHRRGVEGSHKLFANIAKTVGTIIAAGALQKDLVLMNKVVNSMLNGRNGHAFVNAEHRLSRYILGTQAEDQNGINDGIAAPITKESLISHTDWTFMTCIPLSAIPGLQIWKPHAQEWIVPEAIFGNHQGRSKEHHHQQQERTRYVVVMAGKWIELLTNRKITSCVHRVVTRHPRGTLQSSGHRDATNTEKARLSAPFFCRTKRPVFDLIQDEFHESWDRFRSVTQEEAIDAMGHFFGDWIRFLEGDRDPTIPGSVLDLCLDHESDAPGCFSIEEILGDR
mmetsp:Transcript_7230/g.17625  ORF Transcript_7230/g.17625 Transcript_7230/m.17625 type:complete len:609 (+) Transcript_7230:153-1979(+)